MDKHVTLVATLNIGLGVLGVMVGCIVFVVLIFAGIVSGDPQAMKVTTIVGVSVGTFVIFVSVPLIIGGIGLLKRCPWSRILILILAAMNLLNLPVGTAIAVYTIWVMLQDETVKMFSSTPKPKKA
jgi:hypothetical protein